MKPNDAVHRKAECTLRDHPTLRRWLTQPPATGRLSADRSQVAAEARRDAKYLLATSDPDLPAEDAAPGYKNVLERSVPLHDEVHALPAACLPPPGRADTRPRAAVPGRPLLPIRVAERRARTTWHTIRNEIGRIHQATLAGPRRPPAADHPHHRRPGETLQGLRRAASTKDERRPDHRIAPELGKQPPEPWTHASGNSACHSPRSPRESADHVCLPLMKPGAGSAKNRTSDARPGPAALSRVAACQAADRHPPSA